MTKDRETPIRILVLAGEASGDMHGAALIRALRDRSPWPIRFFGIGGDAMRAAGVETICDIDRMAVMGFWDVLRDARFFRRLMREVTDLLDRERPDLLLTIDYPGFNLRMAARAHARGIAAVHVVCPQVWAWHRGRAPKIARILDRLLVFLPFEPDCFKGTGLTVDFVGHPLVDRARETRAEPAPDIPWAGSPRLALLPGSRAREIDRHLPAMLDTADVIRHRYPKAGFVIPASDPAARARIEGHIRRRTLGATGVSVLDGQARHGLLQARAALVASGTASLEACLMRCPTVVVYRVGWVTYGLGRLLIRGIQHIGLANIIAGREVFPELIQRRFNARSAAAALMPLIEDSPARQTMLDGIDAVNAAMGPGRTDAAAAAAVIETLTRRVDRRRLDRL